jgi:hypothetical protein
VCLLFREAKSFLIFRHQRVKYFGKLGFGLAVRRMELFGGVDLERI